jgi:hypothetical protein
MRASRFLLRRILPILLAMGVGLASWTSDRAIFAGSATHSEATILPDCHNAYMTRVDADEQHARSHQTLDLSFTHGCCFQFVGMVPTPPASVFRGQNADIAFRPALRLLSRAADIYRPPRQNT